MSDTEAKNAPASKRKLQKKRGEGAVPAAQDLAGMLSVAVGLALLLGIAPRIWGRMADGFSGAFILMQDPLSEALPASFDQLTGTLARTVLPVVGFCLAAAVLATIIFNNGIVFSLKPVQPQLERVSPKSGFKRIYGRRGWIETLTGLARITLWLIVAATIAVIWLPQLIRTTDCGGPCQLHIIIPLVLYLVCAAIIIFLIAAGIDMLLQRSLFLHEQKMTQSEVKRERKEQSGSPEIRKERRRRQREMSAGADSVGVAKANMCFYWKDKAISVRFLPPGTPLPRITAKAEGLMAVAKLRATVRAAGHPEIAQENIVKTSMKSEIGSALDQSTYSEFGAAIRTMFGKIPE